MSTKRIELPPKLIPVFSHARGDVRFRAAYGGRGSGKSFTFAKMAAVFGAVESLRILCTREFQNSIKESFHAELKNAINSDAWLASVYDVGIDYIRHKTNKTEFIFRGLRHSMSAIKSMAQIDICIIEEAEDAPEASWLDLEPTIRAPKSEIWVIWNPKRKGSPVDKRFIQSNPPRCAIAEVNYNDNPWFPSVLNEQRLDNKKNWDDATYRHVWEGAYLEHSEAQIFRGKYTEKEFEPHEKLWDGPYYGLDYGFSQDPTAAVKCWIFDRKLWIEYEAGGVGLELDETAQFLKDAVPGISNHKVRADSARPESTSYLKRHGLPMVESVDKWPGSVEDGIAHIKSYDQVVIHPRCRAVLGEFRLYSYKVDRLTTDVLPKIVDDHNHYIDAIRYALAPVIQSGMNSYRDLL